MNELNIFVLILKSLRINYTKSYTNKIFNEHPYKYNLFGLSSMFSDYGIENAGIKISNKSEIRKIAPPFIAHIGNDFVIVNNIFGDTIHFFQSEKPVTVILDEFYKMWTGNLLIAESTEASIEPEYKEQKENFRNIQKYIILSTVIFLFISAIVFNRSYLNIGILLLIIINVFGFYTVYLLILKQLRIQSGYAERLCPLFKYNDCNNILESDATKFFGVIGWSEVGLVYFISNVVFLCFLPAFIPFCVQNVFTSLNEKLEKSNKYLIGTYFQKKGETKDIYDQWFENGKFNKEEFFKIYPIDTNTLEVTKEFDLHEKWKEQSGLRATPTTQVNGFKLPDNFKIEEMRYFSDMDI